VFLIGAFLLLKNHFVIKALLLFRAFQGVSINEVSMKRLISVISLLLIPSICLAGKTGILKVYSEPPGAKIYIDGVYVGITPYQNLEVPIGRYEMRVSLTSDYPEQKKTITVTEKDPVTRTFYFIGEEGGRFGGIIEQEVKYTGRVVFASTPPGALIHLKERPPVTAPTSFKKMDVGRYEVKFTLQGKTLQGNFDVIKNETVQLVADFNKGVIVNKWFEAQKEQARQAGIARLDRETKERKAREEAERREVEKKRQAELARLETERKEREAREEAERKENINRNWIPFLRTIEGNIWSKSRGIPCKLGKDLYVCLQNNDQDDITLENIKNKIIEAKQKEGRSVDLFYTQQSPRGSSITVAIYLKVNGNTLDVYSKQTCSGIFCGDREDNLFTVILPYNEGPF
jgi:hypothetical protein